MTEKQWPANGCGQPYQQNNGQGKENTFNRKIQPRCRASELDLLYRPGKRSRRNRCFKIFRLLFSLCQLDDGVNGKMIRFFIFSFFFRFFQRRMDHAHPTITPSVSRTASSMIFTSIVRVSFTYAASMALSQSELIRRGTPCVKV